jgi:hypothetical protein
LTNELAQSRRQSAQTQDSLRREIAALQSDLSQFDPQHLLQLRRRLDEREAELQELRPRMQRLTAQLRTQEQLETDLGKLRSQTVALRQELLRRGLSANQVKRLVSQAEALPLHALPLELTEDLPQSEATLLLVGGHKETQQRNFQDVRRIK